VSNVRDKLNIGLFDAPHLLAPVAMPPASAGHVKVPIVAPFNLGPQRQCDHGIAGAAAAIMSEIDGDPSIRWRPRLALSREVAARRKSEPNR